MIVAHKFCGTEGHTLDAAGMDMLVKKECRSGIEESGQQGKVGLIAAGKEESLLIAEIAGVCLSASANQGIMAGDEAG